MALRDTMDRLIMGTRAGFGDGNQAIRIASAAALRRKSNWALPGGMTLLVLIVIATINISIGSNPGSEGIGFFLARVVLIDYLIFFFGWLCGWNAAARWRREQSFIEELVMTNLRPGVVGNLLFAGGLSVWSRLLMLVVIADIGLLLATPMRLAPGPLNPDVGFQILSLILSLPTYVALAWFHLETLRIAYWMFAVAALPKLNLLNRAILNFFIIPLYVALLTILGSIVTGILGMVFSAMMVFLSGTGNPDGVMSSHAGWALGTLPSLLFIGAIKRMIAGQYELAFWRSYLLYVWYGAGEKSHPIVYPLHMFQQLGAWVRFLRAEESHMARQETAAPEAPLDPGRTVGPETNQGG